MAAYSPISSRNHRVNTAPPYYISSTANSAISAIPAFSGNAATTSSHTNAIGGSRRRESMNSSIGATSIRRLLTINRGCRHKIPLHIRAKVTKNFTFLILAHGLMCAVLIPLFGLQVMMKTHFQTFSLLLHCFGFGSNCKKINKILQHVFPGIKFNVVSPRENVAPQKNRSKHRAIVVKPLLFSYSHHMFDNHTSHQEIRL